MAQRSDETTKKPKNIEFDPKKTVLLRASRNISGIVVIDEETQRKYPSLLVFPTTLTVQRDKGEKVELLRELRDSEPNFMQRDK